MAMFLLAVSSAVRAVKGVVLVRNGGDVLALASPIEAPTVEALDRSLSALAVACQISGREVQALRDERLNGGDADFLAEGKNGKRGRRPLFRVPEERIFRAAAKVEAKFSGSFSRDFGNTDVH